MTHQLDRRGPSDLHPVPFIHPSPSCPATSVPLRRFAVHQSTTPRWDFDEDVDGYSRAGILSLGVWLKKLYEFGEDRGIELLRDQEMSVSSLSWAGGFTGHAGYGFDQSLDEARMALLLAEDLGASTLVAVSGPRWLHTEKHARRIFVDALKMLADMAGSRGIRLAIQPSTRQTAGSPTFVNSLDEALSLIDACGNHPAVGLAFDVYPFWQERGLSQRLAEIAPRTAIVQLSDWDGPPRTRHDRSALGEGRIPLADLVSAFVNHGYDGFFELMLWSDELWKSDYNQLLHGSREQFDRLSRYGR